MSQINNHILAKHNTKLMEEVVKRSNLKKALERVERNRGAAGVDNMQVEELRPYLKLYWQDIQRELLEGTYKPAPVRRVEIPKPDGGVRQLGIPTVLDRFIQQSIQQVLTLPLNQRSQNLATDLDLGKAHGKPFVKLRAMLKVAKELLLILIWRSSSTE